MQEYFYRLLFKINFKHLNVLLLLLVMFKSIFQIVFTIVCATVALAQQPLYPNPEASAQIVRQSSDTSPDGSYNYAYETSNGIYADEQGYPKSPEILAAQGQFQYVAPDGQVIRVAYTADENGFQPQGEHLPTPPPVPAAIQRALNYLATLPPQRR